jgi:hypothetical protein
MTTDKRIYRELADAGNEHAKHILDAGVIPDAEMDEAVTSEAEELKDLEELAAHLGMMLTKARAHIESRDYMRAADTFAEIGQFHETQGNHREAMDAYRAGMTNMFQHASDCGYAEGYDLPQIRAIHARQNAEGGK